MMKVTLQRVPGAIGRGASSDIPSKPMSHVCAGLVASPWTTVADCRSTLRGEARRLRSWGSGEMLMTGSR